MSGFNHERSVAVSPVGRTSVSMRSIRHYRSDIPYALPIDVQEINRQDFQHFVMRSTTGANYFAPIARNEKPAAILDVGSGTGLWGHELCREYPDAQVYGLDIEHVMRPDAPGNYRPVAGNLLQPLPFKNDSFDFVHQRFVSMAIPLYSWPRVIQQLARVTRPGGWIELVEDNGVYGYPSGPITTQIIEDIKLVTSQKRIDLDFVQNLDQLFEQEGLLHIHKKVIPVPLGRWGGRVGSLMSTNVQAITGSFKDAFVGLLRYTPEYFDSLQATMLKEWQQQRSTCNIFVYYAQKP